MTDTNENAEISAKSRSSQFVLSAMSHSPSDIFVSGQPLIHFEATGPVFAAMRLSEEATVFFSL